MLAWLDTHILECLTSVVLIAGALYGGALFLDVKKKK
jgi:hypothetical protein